MVLFLEQRLTSNDNDGGAFQYLSVVWIVNFQVVEECCSQSVVQDLSSPSFIVKLV